MKTPISGSFNEIVDAFARIVAKNPTLAQKHGWPDYREAQENWLDEREARRMAAHGWHGFIEMEGELPPLEKKKTSLVARAGAVAGKVKTALAIYRDLFGPDGKVVAKEEAERRASICSVCPRNDLAGGLTKYFLKEAASEIMMVAGMLKKRNVSTSLDDKLGVCQICLCPLGAKIHVESDILKKHIKPDEIAKLPANCWIPPAIA